jgi:leucine dehydrogenase
MQPETYDYHSDALGFSSKIVIHNTLRGPALGGLRLWQYPDDAAALTDASRLAEGMTYKAALAGLDLGGGKSCIYFDDRAVYGTNRVPEIPADLRAAVFREFGRFVESLGGRYITAEDMGTAVEDMQRVHESTNHVVGLRQRSDGRQPSGDPSPITALGVYAGMKAAARHAFGSDSLAGRTILVQGIGKVGSTLSDLLAAEGARLFVHDMKPERMDAIIRKHGATPVAAVDVHSLAVDIYSPNARGEDAITAGTVKRLQCKVVAGAANNQLWGGNGMTAEDIATELRRRGIPYAPDFAINAGGLINVYREIKGYDEVWARSHAIAIGQTIEHILNRADQEGISTRAAARKLAEERLRDSA